VRLKENGLPRLYIHVEIQCQKDEGFGKRMFWYNTYIRRKFDESVVSIAVLADEVKQWKPTTYVMNKYGCYTKIQFMMVKLLGYQSKRVELARSDNPFSALLLTHLVKMETKGDVDERLERKIELTRNCLQKVWSANDVVSVLRFIRWMLVLPNKYELKYQEAIKTEERTMQLCYFEEEAMEKGMQQGMQQGLLEGKHAGSFAGASI